MKDEFFNFYTDISLDLIFNKKNYHCELGVFCLVSWDNKWIPNFKFVKYQVNNIKLKENFINPEKKLLDFISVFCQDRQDDLLKSVLKEYMMFAYICESQKYKNDINPGNIVQNN